MTYYVFACDPVLPPAGVNVKIDYLRTNIYANVCFLKIYVIILICQALCN